MKSVSKDIFRGKIVRITEGDMSNNLLYFLQASDDFSGYFLGFQLS